jgi:hypothetical protein
VPGDTTIDHAYREILSRLDTLQGLARDKVPDKAPVIPLIDPTANVLALVGAETKRQDDLRAAEANRVKDIGDLTEKFADKLEQQRQFFETQAKTAEAGRIDSLLAADKANVALALAKQEAQAQAQDKRIAALEQNQYQGVGAGSQAREGRQQNQWVIGVVIAVAIFLANFLSGLMRAK